MIAMFSATVRCGKRPDLLEHVADAAAQSCWIDRGDVSIEGPDGAGRGIDQAVDGLEQRGLARSGFADDDDEFAGANVERDVANGVA